MRLRYAWIDAAWAVPAIAILIPLMVHLAGILIDFIADVAAR